MEQFAPMANVEVAHLALDAARIEAPATARAAAGGHLVEHRVAPVRQALRGNGRSLRHFSLDHAQCVNEAQSVWLGVMTPHPQIADVLDAKDRIGSVQFALVNRFFQSTWSASYVRLVELESAVHTTLPVALAHALWNDPSLPDYSPEDWLPNVSFNLRNVTAVRRLVEHALSDIEQSGGAGNALAQHLRAISFKEISAIYELEGSPGGPRPVAPRHYGPTYQIMWQFNGRFFFLEVHNES